MPKDNNQQPATNNSPVSTADDMPPIMIEDTLPPMAMDNQPPPVTSPQSPSSDSGSAAPSDDIVIPQGDIIMPSVTTTQKKKFAGGKIIATILGLFLLIGGAGAGVFLVQQNQDIREKAGSCSTPDHPGGCGPGYQCDGNGGCIPRGSGDDYSGPVIEPPDNPWGGDGGDPADGNNCDVRCQGTDTRGQSYDFCIDRTSTKGCDDSAVEKGYTVQIASDTKCLGGECGTETWFCKTPPPNNVSCDGKHGGVLRNDLNANSCFCGVLQVDTPTGFKSYKSECGCKKTQQDETTTTTAQTAQCQNIKAYSSTWAPLTNTQLSQLSTGDSVNFCVTGSASSGSFDKARFTINSVVQAETATVRPSSIDFCQLYTIPTGTTTFNVTAQIHHLTLGWK